MNVKFLINVLSLSLFLTFTGYFDSFSEGDFLSIFSITGFLLFFIASLVLHELYNSQIGINKKNKFTKGLSVAIFVGLVVMVIFLSFGDYSYEVQDEYGSVQGSYLYFIIMGIYVFAALICFFVDAFFNSKTKKLNKGKIFLGSLLFFGLNYIFSFIVVLSTVALFGFSKWA